MTVFCILWIHFKDCPEFALGNIFLVCLPTVQTIKNRFLQLTIYTFVLVSCLILASLKNWYITAWFKGTVSRDFLLQIFFMNHLPPSPENNTRVISNFFENMWRYSQVKVHHQYQRHQRQILQPVPLVLLILVANFPPDTGGEQWEQYLSFLSFFLLTARRNA